MSTRTLLSLHLSLLSMRNRLFTSALTILSIALSIGLLLGVEKIRFGAKASFENTVSGTDLVVGAKSGPIELLLYSVFRIGNPSNNISWETYSHWIAQEDIAWSIPISLGDSYRGFRVVGTHQDYFLHYKVGHQRSLSFRQGKSFDTVFEAVVGADVADKLALDLNSKLILSHGISDVSFQDHDDRPFQLVGILNKTGTPVDKAVYVSLEGIEAMHIDWQDGAPPQDESKHLSADDVLKSKLTPKSVTAFFLGLKSKIGIFKIQRDINNYQEEPLLAILPGVTLAQLWETISMADKALLIVSILIILSGVLGMLASLLTTLHERRREMAILRALGAHPRDIFTMLVSEAFFLALVGVLCGIALVYGFLFLAQPWIESHYGVFVPLTWLSLKDMSLLFMVLMFASLGGCIPALAAYRHSLSDGLTVRL